MKVSIDKMGQELFGLSRTDAHNDGVCIKCGQPALANCYSEAGRREYKLSGLCELCFDKMSQEEEED